TMTTTNPTAKSAKEILRQQAIDRLMARGTPEGPIAELLAEVERAIALLSSRESPRYDTALLAGVHEANLRENADLPGID
ncbi:hypothetical protein KC221_29330, partial [Mycobacterium tuberculosis]|nr:hypothetical protein [Mycobacterium tuberculosis]